MEITSKEKEMLTEALEHERICIAKYRSYALQLEDPKLQALFRDLQSKEETHAQTITGLLPQGGVTV